MGTGVAEYISNDRRSYANVWGISSPPVGPRQCPDGWIWAAKPRCKTRRAD